jgi:hypothetical protein
MIAINNEMSMNLRDTSLELEMLVVVAMSARSSAHAQLRYSLRWMRWQGI